MNVKATEYINKLQDAEVDELFTKAILHKGLATLEAGVDINDEKGLESSCKQLVSMLFGKRGYYKDIQLLEVLECGDRAKYSIFIGVKPTKLMEELKFNIPIGTTIYITSSK